MPASTSARQRSRESVAGPRVQTIFARRATPPAYGLPAGHSGAQVNAEWPLARRVGSYNWPLAVQLATRRSGVARTSGARGRHDRGVDVLAGCASAPGRL